jgi:hypothetical protein
LDACHQQNFNHEIIFYLKFKYGALNNGHGIKIIKLYAFSNTFTLTFYNIPLVIHYIIVLHSAKYFEKSWKFMKTCDLINEALSINYIII